MAGLFQALPWSDLFVGFLALSGKHLVMWAIGGFLIWLAVARNYEPALLLPIGFGAILANIPHSAAVSQVIGEEGFLWVLYRAGIANQLFPVLMFIAIGARCDFTPLIRRPGLMLFAAAAQFGIFATAVAAAWLGFPFEQAAAIGLIGAVDGPTAIYVASRYAKELLGPLAVAAYFYMALVPVIQPALIKALTTAKERQIRMEGEALKPVSNTARFLFPLVVTLIAGIVIPDSVALVGSLMFGNLLKESGVVEKLAKTAENELADLVTLLLGITIGGTMEAEKFLSLQAAFIMLLGVAAIVFNTVGSVLFAKLFNLVSPVKINPLLGACGIAALLVSGRVATRMFPKDNFANRAIQPAIGISAAGQVASAMAGGLVLALIPVLAGK